MEKPKLKKKKVITAPPPIDLDDTPFNKYLLQDQMAMSKALFEAVLYINSLENQLGIDLHKAEPKTKLEPNSKAAHYYTAMQQLRFFEHSYLPYDPIKENRNCYRPWHPTTLIEDLKEKDKWLRNTTSLN